MAHLLVRGNAYIGLFRSGDEITQLALIHPDRIRVELRGELIAYILDGRDVLGPADIVHVKAMSFDGLTGLSPVSQCRLTLSLSANLEEHAKRYFENGSRPSGILTMPLGASNDAMSRLAEDWRNRHGGVEKAHGIAVIDGDAKFQPVAFSADDSQFLQQRQLSATECARVFGLQPFIIGASSGDSLTYSNVTQQNLAFVTHSLRPWLVRIERAITSSVLCPGGTYIEFSLDGLLRADPDQRSAIYARGLDPERGWLRRSEVREFEDLEPESEAGNE
jgi:HK97 family phage portal protein